MEEELQQLRKKLQEAETRASEELQRRKDAEQRVEASQPQTLQPYLECCHRLSLAIRVVTDRSLTTQGDTTNPAGRIFPRFMRLWEDFATKQEDVWDQITATSFSSRALFPSQHQLDYVLSLTGPISSEIGLRNFERDTVENAVQKLVEGAYGDPQLRRRLGLLGTVTFESHTNLGDDDTMSEPMERLSIEGDDEAPAVSKGRRKGRGKGNRADQFCIYRSSDGRNIPSVAIEYKAPHKLRRDEVVVGLESEVQPQRDVINKDGDGFAFASKKLAAAVITQLFSYMVGKGIQYGYLCTGEVLVFVRIPDDPSIVYYHVCVPNLDVQNGDDARLHRTAVGQVFAFILQALSSRPPSMSWHDRAADLDLWAVEYEDVLRNIPETVRKTPRATPYKPGPWRHFKRSPIRLRSRCQQSTDKDERWEEEDDEDEAGPSSPTLGLRSGPCRRPEYATIPAKEEKDTGRGKHTEGREHGQATQQTLGDRLYCTQQCLLGLAHGGLMDETCPNFDEHGKQHISQLEFLDLLRCQLANDRDHDADCVPLHLSGRYGSVYKVRLSSHGYVFVAKGLREFDILYLRRESNIYDRLRPIQGKHVPVHLGNIDLVRPYYYDGRVFITFMLLSWGGQPLFESVNAGNKASILNGVAAALMQLHQLRVRHCDAKARNVLYDTHSGNVMVVDFGRAKFRRELPLGAISGNSRKRKRKRDLLSERGDDDFTKELDAALASVSRCAENLAEPVRPDIPLGTATNEDIREASDALTKAACHSDRELANLTRPQDHRLATRQCGETCSTADSNMEKHVSTFDKHATGDGIHFMVSTEAKPIHSGISNNAWRRRQIGGHISDYSIQHLVEDAGRDETKPWPREGNTSCGPNHDIRSRPGPEFMDRYGPGVRSSL